jgi:ParB-like nuclease domain
MQNAVLSKVKEGLGFSIDELLVNRGIVVEEMELSDIDASDRTFAVHDPAPDIEGLIESIHRDGQVEPVIVRRVGSRWQLIDGFRRVAAAQHLNLTRIKARRFDALSVTDAALFVVKNIHADLPHPDALRTLAVRLEDRAEIDAAALLRRYADSLSVVEDAPTEEASDEQGEEAHSVEAAVEESRDAPSSDEHSNDEVEVTPDELADQVNEGFARLSDDLQLVQENWADLDPERKEATLTQLRYYAEL